MTNKPSALVVSVAEDDPLDTVKLMLGVEDLPEAAVLNNEIHAFPLHIDTKYYSADIHLCTMKSKTIGSREFAEGVGAVVIKFDSEKENIMQEVESWLPFIKEMAPEVQILLCEKCLEQSVKGSSRMDVQRWCVENRFELVELNPDDDSEDEEDMALPGLAVTTGIKRVMQALKSHLWPNMQMKDKKNTINPALAAYINGSAPDEDPIANLSDNLQDLNVENTQITSTSMMSRIDQLLGADEEGMSEDLEMAPEMEFANLLSRLNEVKEQAATMPSDQRKMCAEQVVKAFWNAIGGDEDEVFDEILQEFHSMEDQN